MFIVSSSKTSSIPSVKSGRQHLAGLRLLCLAAVTVAGAAQAQAIGYATGYNVTYVLCRSDAEATQYSQTKASNTWVAYTSAGKTQNWIAGYRDDNSVHLNSADGTKQVQIDLFLQTCKSISVTKGTSKTTMVDTMATTAPRPAN